MSGRGRTSRRAARAFPYAVIVQRIAVPFQYPVYFTRDLFAATNPLLASVLDRHREGRCHRVLVYLDAGVAAAVPKLEARVTAYFDRRPGALALAAPVRTLGGGEAAKIGWRTALEITGDIARERLCRHSFVLAVGGGGLLDVVGFATSLVHRGLRLVRVPTTALAQNDVGVGVKTGLDDHATKNFIGTFAPPFAVLNDFDFLRTLADRDWRGGIAEAFKVAIIKDAAFFDFLCRHAGRLRRREQGLMERLVRRCAELHLAHIRTGGDPFEMGSARPLDFGHWSAHMLEDLSGYALGHGQAVAIGVALDAVYAARLGLLTRPAARRIVKGLLTAGLPVWDAHLERRGADGRLRVLAGLERFREHLGGALTVTLPDALGHCTEVNEIQPARVEEALAELRRAWETAEGSPVR